jgi:hypothetical protein
MRYVMFAGNRLKLGELQVHGKVYEHEEGEHEEGVFSPSRKFTCQHSKTAVTIRNNRGYDSFLQMFLPENLLV